MKNFIIIVETAMLAFILGIGVGADWEERKHKQEENDEVTDENPA